MKNKAPKRIKFRGATYQKVGSSSTRRKADGSGYSEDDLEEFWYAYAEAALWTAAATDYTLGPGPDPDDEETPHGSIEWERAMDEITVDGLLDAGYGPEDLAPDCKKAMMETCRKFMDRFGAELNDLEESPTRHSVLEQAGHDYFLTSHGHGVGFRDRDWPEPLKSQMVKYSSGYAETYMWVDTDGVVNCDP